MKTILHFFSVGRLGVAATVLALSGIFVGCSILCLLPPDKAQAAEPDDSARFHAGYLEACLAMENGQHEQAIARLELLSHAKGCPPAVFATLARIHMLERNPDTAIEVLDTGLKAHPRSARLYSMRAKVRAQRKNTGEAIEDLEAALEIRPKSQMLLEELSSLHLQRLQGAKSEAQVEDEGKALIEIYERMLEGRQGRKRIVPLLVLSWLYQQFDQPESALEHAREAVELNPREVRAHMAMGAAYETLHQTDEALECFRQALLADPQNSEVLDRIEELFAASDNKDDRLNFYRELASSFPDVKAIQTLFSKQLIEAKRWEEAEQYLNNILKQWPEDRDAPIDRLSVWAHLGRSDELNAALDKYVASGDELGALAVLMVAEVFVNENQIDRAIAALETYERNGQLNDNVTLALGTILVEHERYDRAIEVLEGYHQRNPDSCYATLLLASSLAEREKYDKAHELLDAISENDRERYETEILKLRAQLWRRQKQNDRARKVFEDLIERNPKEPGYLLELGFLDQEAGNLATAENAYLKALELAPDDPEVCNTLGYFYAETNQKLDEALQLILKAIERKPNAGHIIDSLGWVFYQRGDFQTAVEKLENAVILMADQPDAVVYEHLGDAYEKVGKHVKARDAWRKALDLSGDDKRLGEKINHSLID